VTGTSNLNDVNASGDISGGGNFDLTGNALIQGGLVVDKDLLVNGGATIAGEAGLTVSGGPTSVQELTADGFFKLTNDGQTVVDINGERAYFYGPMEVERDLKVDGALAVEGASTLDCKCCRNKIE
jgi:cytoskeletal protein CcmA (bactofilin family)